MPAKTRGTFDTDSIGDLYTVDLGQGFRMSDTPQHWVEFCRDIIREVRQWMKAQGGHPVAGTWPTDDLRRAFVDGVAWHEFTSTGATMFPSDRDVAEVEAEMRYPGGNNKWVAVVDAFPEWGERVLVCYDTTCIENAIDVCHFDGKLWWITKNRILQRDATMVHHWMKLPTAPGN